ncbi:hypothetical protein MTAT_04750 [Moorella thermoacetica]|uniref:Sporulation-specific N-acetylmuramoyl-L-alanine amidase n=1 Tax=Neomoorella thermoacetica TaxID=1525 RepID=A0AAC9HKE2_NEOTH|nr:N-acetylmuramoyl-L-alanine amidase [Moorella thermoacetica]AOQ24726.1 Sporulation-specific N-acetylmuramoyl-L-alanine amidase [Moorella thermoacetica]TYL15736.1 hypothetical protein MTAT_04750 [Moorella thermoacetica]
MARVVVDPGHGGYDSGAVGPSGLRESDVTLAVCLQLRDILVAQGIEVFLTRDGDYVPGGVNEINADLAARCRLANEQRADYFISVHCNSASAAAHGTETYCYLFGGQGEQLARAVQSSLIKDLGLTDRGVRSANYYVLRKTNMPAILTELAFISNPIEERMLADPKYQAVCARAIAKGIFNYLHIQVVLGMFNDVINHWAQRDIEWLAQKGLVKGDDNGNFRPDAPATRAELAVMVKRAIDYVLKVK